MAQYQASGTKIAFTRFGDVAANLGKENDTFGKGSIVLPPAILSYREAWGRYRALARDVLGTVTPTERAQWDVVAEFIDDDVRTILIARSIRRLIDSLLAKGSQEIQVVEAGFGTGFLAAVALATSDKVTVVGYDLQSAKVSVAQQVCTDLGFDHKRFLFEKKAIEGNIAMRSPDMLVVAEHISAGLMHELSTDIPRKFDGVVPTACIPYAVHPQLFVTGNQFATVISGEEIVLADRDASDAVHIHGRLQLPAGYCGALKVANGVTWSGVSVPGMPPVQQSDTRRVRVEGPRNHLLRSTCLHATCDREVNSFWYVRNSCDHPQEVEIMITYPVGFLVNQKAAPKVSILSGDTVTVYPAPIDTRIFAQYVTGLRRGE